ncbi:hypothetical protein KAR91_30110 [Candidatus Pacearchaeota archaeon]|nr:hypothetical protein [Candidatus Pacearchaeota archaeon]
MDNFNIDQLLNLGPYGLLILFGFWLIRWFQKEYWPHYVEKDKNREAIIVEAVKDINSINEKLSNLEESGKDGVEAILEDFKDVKNLLTVALKKELN